MKNIFIKNQQKKSYVKTILFYGLILFFVFLIIPQKTFAFEILPSGTITPAYKVLSDTSTGAGASIYTVWKNIINLANSLVIILLIGVAFAQILRLNINTYGVKKILPALVMAIVAANFSWLFCRLMIDFSNVIMSGLIKHTGADNPTALTGVLGGGNGDSGWASPDNGTFSSSTSGLSASGATVFWFLLLQFVLIGLGVISYILAFLFFIRLWLIYFLVPLAPLAFMATVLPQTKSLFNQWWSNFLKWVFMPIVSVFWIWLGSRWIGTVSNSTGWFMQILFACLCFYLALTTPFKMGGAVMNAWGGLGKKAWGKTGGWAMGRLGDEAKAVAGGKFQSYMAMRNLNAAKEWENSQDPAGKARAAQLRNRASQWARLAPATWKEGISSRLQQRSDAINGARKKTIFANYLAGAGATVKAGYDSNIEDYRGADNALLLSEAQTLVDNVRGSHPDIMKPFDNAANDSKHKQTMKNMGLDQTKVTDRQKYANRLFLNAVRTDTADVLANNMKNAGMSDYEIGQSKAMATVFMQRLSSTRGKSEIWDKFASSAVGVTGQNVTVSQSQNHQAKIEQLAGDKAGDLIVAALKGEDATHLVSGLSAESTTAVKESLESIRNQVKEETTSEIKNLTGGFGLDGMNVGFKRVEDLLAKGNSPLQTNNIINEQIKKANENPGFLDAAELQSYQQAKVAMDTIFAQRRDGLISKDLRDFSQMVAETQKNIQQQALSSAQFNVAGQMVTGKIAGNQSAAAMTPGQFMGSEYAEEMMQEMTNAINGLKHSVDEGGVAAVASGLSPQDINAKGILNTAMNDAMKNIGQQQAQTISNIFTSKNFQTSLANGMKRAMSESTIKTKPVGNASQPPAQSPVK